MFGFNKIPTGDDASAPGFFQRLKQGMRRTRSGLIDSWAHWVKGKKAIDAEVLEELETRLLSADVGVAATQRLIDGLTTRLKRQQLGDAEALFAALREDMRAILAPCDVPLKLSTAVRPYIVLMVGVNGVGKTTTIGKLAQRFKGEGHTVILAAGDTFRAAAIEQLKTWGERNGVAVIAQARGADPASVMHDAVQAARARNADVLIADTAGRLHTQAHLMEELKKIKRIIAKLDPAAPHEIMLVIDAGTGQNALHQARLFHEAVGLTGIVLTKLDGTAKGGIVFAIAEQMRLPIRYIGVGEGIDDLRPFDAEDFVAALFADGRETPDD